jgi:hypothetical protein
VSNYVNETIQPRFRFLDDSHQQTYDGETSTKHKHIYSRPDPQSMATVQAPERTPARKQPFTLLSHRSIHSFSTPLPRPLLPHSRPERQSPQHVFQLTRKGPILSKLLPGTFRSRRERGRTLRKSGFGVLETAGCWVRDERKRE